MGLRIGTIEIKRGVELSNGRKECIVGGRDRPTPVVLEALANREILVLSALRPEHGAQLEVVYRRHGFSRGVRSGEKRAHPELQATSRRRQDQLAASTAAGISHM